LLGALALSGCVQLGPNFQRPALPWIDSWNSPALAHASQQQPQPDLTQ
jgi:hypothetical protein